MQANFKLIPLIISNSKLIFVALLLKSSIVNQNCPMRYIKSMKNSNDSKISLSASDKSIFNNLYSHTNSDLIQNSRWRNVRNIYKDKNAKEIQVTAKQELNHYNISLY